MDPPIKSAGGGSWGGSIGRLSDIVCSPRCDECRVGKVCDAARLRALGPLRGRKPGARDANLLGRAFQSGFPLCDYPFANPREPNSVNP